MPDVRFNPWVLVVASLVASGDAFGWSEPRLAKQACKSRRHLRPFSLELRIREQRPIQEVQKTATRCRTLAASRGFNRRR